MLAALHSTQQLHYALRGFASPSKRAALPTMMARPAPDLRADLRDRPACYSASSTSFSRSKRQTREQLPGRLILLSAPYDALSRYRPPFLLLPVPQYIHIRYNAAASLRYLATQRADQNPSFPCVNSSFWGIHVALSLSHHRISLGDQRSGVAAAPSAPSDSILMPAGPPPLAPLAVDHRVARCSRHPDALRSRRLARKQGRRAAQAVHRPRRPSWQRARLSSDLASAFTTLHLAPSALCTRTLDGVRDSEISGGASQGPAAAPLAPAAAARVRRRAVSMARLIDGGARGSKRL